jgi:RHS repeat-associated protein
MSDVYRYGFNGKEQLNEDSTEGSSYDFGARMLDSGIGGHFLTIDPLSYKFPSLSPYSFALNSPIIFNDPDGRVSRLTIEKSANGGGTIILQSTIHIYGPSASEELAKGTEDFFRPIISEPYTYIDAEGNSWSVQLQVTFQYSPALDSYANVVDDSRNPGDKINDTAPWNVNCMKCNGPSALDLIGYTPGDNFQYIDESLAMNGGSVLDRTQYGGVQGTTVVASPSILAHGVGHNLGFDDDRLSPTVMGLSLQQKLGESNSILIAEKGIELSSDLEAGDSKTIVFSGRFDEGMNAEERKELIDQQSERQ